jgi:hypothetical protein
MNASPIKRSVIVLLLQAWSTATVQTTNRKTASAPRIFRSMDIPFKEEHLMLAQDAGIRSDRGHV